MMFRRLYVDNFRCLVNFELRLQELTLLLGSNGVGKTSVLDVIFALRQLLSGAAKVADPGIFTTRTLTRWQSVDLQVVEAEVHLDQDKFIYRLEVEHERPAQRARIKLEQLTANGQPLFHCAMGQVTLYRDDHGAGPSFGVDWSESALARVAPRQDNKRLTRFLEFARKIVVCGLYPANFQAESATEDPLLDRDARNFAGWYRHLLLERQDLVPEYIDALRDVVDNFKGVRLEKVGLDTRALMVMFEEQGKRYELRLDEISDGHRALLALYALVRLAAGQGYVLFLDEPDNYVALREIQPWLIELADRSGESLPQTVLCSHHPEIIDYLGSDKGILLKRETTGVIRTEKLADKAANDTLPLSELVARGWER